jgi:hypothetical protein
MAQSTIYCVGVVHDDDDDDDVIICVCVCVCVQLLVCEKEALSRLRADDS